MLGGAGVTAQHATLVEIAGNADVAGLALGAAVAVAFAQAAKGTGGCAAVVAIADLGSGGALEEIGAAGANILVG